jgi:hypothetical protein
MSEGLERSGGSTTGSDWKINWKQQAKQRLVNHRFGQKLGEGRTESAKSDFETAFKQSKGIVQKARDVVALVSEETKKAQSTDSKSPLATDLQKFAGNVAQLARGMTTEGAAIKTCVSKQNYHGAIAAVGRMETNAQQVIDQEDGLYRILAKHNADLPSSALPNVPGADEFDNAFAAVRSQIGTALAIDVGCDPLKEAQQSLDKSFQESIRARKDGDIPGAMQFLGISETRLHMVTQVEQGWQDVQSELTKNAQLFSRVDNLDTSGSQKQKEYKDTSIDCRNKAATLAKAGDFKMAKAQLASAANAAYNAEVQLDKEQYERQMDPVQMEVDATIKRIEKKVYGDPPDPAVAKDIADFEAARSRMNAATVGRVRNYTQACLELTDMVSAMRRIQKFEADQADALIALSSDTNVKKKDILKTVQERLNQDPDALKAIASRKDGRKFLDELMSTQGSSAKSDEEKQLAMAALEARYDLKIKRTTSCTCGALSGEEKKGEKCKLCGDPVSSPKWTTKALPKMYAVLGMVPESHVANNPSLAKLTRHREFDASWYDPNQKAVVINEYRSGGFLGGLMNVGESVFGSGLKNKKTPQIVNSFSWTTLHEIGHAVDDKVGFMDKRQRMKPYGAWQGFDPMDRLGIMGDQLGFYAAFPKYSRLFLEKYLRAIMDGVKDPSTDSGLAMEWRLAVGKAARVPQKDNLLSDAGIQQAVRISQALDQLDPRPRKFEELDQTTQGQVNTAKNAVRVAGDKMQAWEILDKIVYDGGPPDKAIDQYIASVGEIKDPTATPDWKALDKHAAIDWCRHTSLKGEDSGLWDAGESGAKKYAVGARVYQQSYSKSWWSYDIAARGKRLTNYQFRAPGEWFAESYAAYFMGKLAKDHPVAAWLRNEEAKDQ